MSNPSKCFGESLHYNHDLDKINGLSEEMKKLWIDTKLKQLEINVGSKLNPIDKSEMNVLITDAMFNVEKKMDGYEVITCSISGGSDSDVVLDMLCRSTKKFDKIHYIFFDTGIEYNATKEHLEYLEKKYGIQIIRRKAVKSIPFCCHEYGLPFLSKYASENISRLQRHGFQWEDEPYEVLVEKYPKCRSSIEWWCNKRESALFNINRNRYLKEFLIQNPPDFKISNKCCKYAKKDVVGIFNREISATLSLSGVRRAEGGVRASAYKSCFSDNGKDIPNFRPIFWFTNEDKEKYCRACDVTHSDCYTKYGMTRTGCAGCPFGRDFEEELRVIQTYEPKLFTMVNNVFGKSYEYTRKYKEFVRKMTGEIE